VDKEKLIKGEFKESLKIFTEPSTATNMEKLDKWKLQCPVSTFVNALFSFSHILRF